MRVLGIDCGSERTGYGIIDSDGVGHRITGDRTGRSNSRGIGWKSVHLCIDDASRVAFSQVLPDERKESAVGLFGNKPVE